MSPRSRVAVSGFARGLGWVLGPIALFCLVPYGLCRLSCVPLRTTCEDAGGDPMSVAHFDSCMMPQPVDALHPCPAGHHAGSGPGADPRLCYGGLSGSACVVPGTH